MNFLPNDLQWHVGHFFQTCRLHDSPLSNWLEMQNAIDVFDCRIAGAELSQAENEQKNYINFAHLTQRQLFVCAPVCGNRTRVTPIAAFKIPTTM